MVWWDDDGDGGEERVLSVVALTREIKSTLAEAYPTLWVEGEVSRLTRSAAGHVYFTLRDREEGGGQEATLSAVLFRGGAVRHGSRLREGGRVQCRGRIDVYPPRGSYQLLVDQVREVGAGDLLLELERRKQRLAAEGLFAAERKRPLPFLPRTIGIVTSPTGAALRDVLKVLRTRFPSRVLVAPALVQGERAPEELVAGLRRLDARPDVDVILLTRGGGSLEDLWCWNDEGLARAVAEARTPVVSAVGHEIDTVLTDLVADLRAPTPSAAAKELVPDRRELQARVTEIRRRAERATRQGVETRSLRLDELRSRCQAAQRAQLARQRRRVAAIRAALQRRHPGATLASGRARLARLRERLLRAGTRELGRRRERLLRLTTALRTLGPDAQLARGYSIVRLLPSKVVLRASDAASTGDRLDIRLHRGSLRARVEETDGTERGARRARTVRATS